VILNGRRHLLGALEKVGAITVFGASLLLYPVIATRSPILAWAFVCNLAAFAVLPTTYVIYGLVARRHKAAVTADKRCGKCHAAVNIKDERCRSCGSWFKW
jgi:hypothetical protein